MSVLQGWGDPPPVIHSLAKAKLSWIEKTLKPVLKNSDAAVVSAAVADVSERLRGGWGRVCVYECRGDRKSVV